MPWLRLCNGCPVQDEESTCRLGIEQACGELSANAGSDYSVRPGYHTYALNCTASLNLNGDQYIPEAIDVDIVPALPNDIHQQPFDPELTKHFDEKLRQESLQQDVFNRLPSGTTLVTAQFGIHEDPC